MTGSAHFSPCRTWRYSLTREITDPAESCYGPQGGTDALLTDTQAEILVAALKSQIERRADVE